MRCGVASFCFFSKQLPEVCCTRQFLHTNLHGSAELRRGFLLEPFNRQSPSRSCPRRRFDPCNTHSPSANDSLGSSRYSGQPAELFPRRPCGEALRASCPALLLRAGHVERWRVGQPVRVPSAFEATSVLPSGVPTYSQEGGERKTCGF